VRNAAWGCDWVGTPVPFQRSLLFIIATANKEFTLTAGKFAPVCNKTMMNVRTHIDFMGTQTYFDFIKLLTQVKRNIPWTVAAGINSRPLNNFLLKSEGNYLYYL
jgi:hypothetical protein